MLRHNSFLHFPKKILMFWKKLANMKIFIMQLAIKKSYNNF